MPAADYRPPAGEQRRRGRRHRAQVVRAPSAGRPYAATELLHGRAQRGPRRGYYYQLAAAAGWSSLPFLPLIRQPTLVLCGDDDPLIPTVNAKVMHRLLPHAELHIYHGGHLALLSDATELAPIVEGFLG